MTKNLFLILKSVTKEQIVDKVEALRGMPMREGSHGYSDFPHLSIGDAAKLQAEKFQPGTSGANKNAAIVLMSVVLAANRNYEKQVHPHIQCVNKHFSQLTLFQLGDMLKKIGWKEFKDIWGHADEKKHKTLQELVSVFLNNFGPAEMSDYDRINKWAESAQWQCRKDDPIGKVKNVGIATFQHLRLAFGVVTVKPDVRVMQVLEKEFDAKKINPEKAILAVEGIACITERTVTEIDQIFVKYGSGYY